MLISLTGEPLDVGQIQKVAAEHHRVDLHGDARKVVQASRARVEAVLDDNEPHYGINTGFGSLSRQRIGPAGLRELQTNIVRSHAAGVGDPLPEPTVRAMMLLLAASLARGLSGVRPAVIDALIDLLNARVTPVVPAIGSVGASGDLAPLAHVAQVLMGEGEATHQSTRLSGKEAVHRAGLSPIELEAKEGLALLNGTHLMAAGAALLCERFDRFANAAIIACAMSIDADKATHEFLDPRVYDARRQPGPATVAARLRALLDAGDVAGSHRDNDPRVQDPYSFRCAPIVIGAAIDAARTLRTATEHELGAVTDNPLVFSARDDADLPDIVSAGNFHGMPLAIPLDVLTISIAHIAGIAERRVYWILAASEPESGLRPYLAPKPGLESGLMLAQYTAAACCNELIGLATPASVANISTCAGIEDYNSFGPRAAAKAERALDLAERVVAIELISAAEGLECHRPLRSGPGVEQAFQAVRSIVTRRDADRSPGPDIESLAAALRDGLLETDA